MINFILYITATLIWGSTWLGIKLQLAQVPPVLSVGYRFCLASIGNVVGSRNAKSGVPVTQANVYGMAYGALLCIAIHFGIGGELTMDWTFGYLGPMLYLTVFGSVVAFGCYMLLIGQIGADYAAYVMLLMPVVALIFSTFFEEYQWSANAVFGVIVVLVGNLIILTPAETLEKAFRKIG